MENFLLAMLTLAYWINGVVSIFAYWPTIKDLYIHKKPSANIPSYALWTMTSGIAFLYGILILQDWLFRVVSGIWFLMCGTVLILAIRLRYQKQPE